MKYFRKLKGAPPTVLIGGKATGTVPLPVEPKVLNRERVRIRQLLENGWIEEVVIEEATPVPAAVEPEPEPEVDTEPTPMEGRIDGVDDNVAAPFVEPEPEPEEDEDTSDDSDEEPPPPGYDVTPVMLSVSKLKEALLDITDPDHIRELLATEEAKDSPRVSAVSALKEHLAELES